MRLCRKRIPAHAAAVWAAAFLVCGTRRIVNMENLCGVCFTHADVCDLGGIMWNINWLYTNTMDVKEREYSVMLLFTIIFTRAFLLSYVYMFVLVRASSAFNERTRECVAY